MCASCAHFLCSFVHYFLKWNIFGLVQPIKCDSERATRLACTLHTHAQSFEQNIYRNTTIINWYNHSFWTAYSNQVVMTALKGYCPLNYIEIFRIDDICMAMARELRLFKINQMCWNPMRWLLGIFMSYGFVYSLHKFIEFIEFTQYIFMFSYISRIPAYSAGWHHAFSTSTLWLLTVRKRNLLCYINAPPTSVRVIMSISNEFVQISTLFASVLCHSQIYLMGAVLSGLDNRNLFIRATKPKNGGS